MSLKTMNNKFTTSLIAVCFLIESIGINNPHLTPQPDKNTLRPMSAVNSNTDVIEVNPKNGVECIKEKDPKTGKYRPGVYIYPEGKYELNTVQFKYDENDKVEKIDVSLSSNPDAESIIPFRVSRNFTFLAVPEPERSSSGCGWAVIQIEEGSDIDKVYRFSLRDFDKEGNLKQERFYKLGLEATVEENLLSFAGLHASKLNFSSAIACELLEGIFKAVQSGRTLKEGLPENSLISTLGEIQNLHKIDQKTRRDLRELRWVDEHSDSGAEVKAEEKYSDTLSLLSTLVTAVFTNACHDKRKIRYLLRALKTVSGDWAANVLLDPRELHLALPKNPKAQMLVVSEITSAIKGELWRRRGTRTRYDKFLLQYLFFWAQEGDADFIIKLIRNIEGDSHSLTNIKLKEGHIQESWEDILYLYASMALVSSVFGTYDLSDDSLDFLFLKLGEFLEQTKDGGQITDESSLRRIGDRVQNIIGMLAHIRDKRLYEYLITLVDHPLDKYMSENYPNLPVDFIIGGFGAIYPLLEKDKEKQEKIREILIKRLNHSDVWRALAAAEELVRIKEPVCAKALSESYEKLRAQLQEKDIPVLNKIYSGLRNHTVLPIILSMVSEKEASLGRQGFSVFSNEAEFRDRISKVTQEYLGVLRFIKDEVSKTLPDDLIKELADNFLYPDDEFKRENISRVIELLRKFAYTESGYDEYETIYYLYKIRPTAGKIRADLFIERFPEISKVVNGAHALAGPIFLKLFGINESGRPIMPDGRFSSQIVHMKQRMGTKERPGLSQIVDKIKNFGTNWPVLSAVASQMLLQGNIKEPVYMLGEEISGGLSGGGINYQPFFTLNDPDLVREAYNEIVKGLGESEKTRLGSHLANELNHSLIDFIRRPELFNIYADEIAAILAEFPFADRSHIDDIISRLIFLRRKGIEFRYMRRNYEDFRLGDLVGDCTEISGTNFWSVPTFLAHPFYQTVLVYYEGQLVQKVDFTLIEKSGKHYLAIDAYEPIPQLDDQSESASPTLIDKREEIYLETINKIREIAKAIGVAGIHGEGTSNRKYIEGVFKLVVDTDTGEEKHVECVKPGLYNKYFGDKKDQQDIVRLLGGLDVIGSFVTSMEGYGGPVLSPLLIFKEGKPQILFQTAKSLTGKEKMLRLFGRMIERHLSIIRARSGAQYPYKELDKAISELDFQKAIELIFKRDDQMYRDLREVIEQQADKIYTEVGKLPGTLEEKTRRALELTFGPSGVEGYAELYEIPFEQTEREREFLHKPAEGSGNTELPLFKSSVILPTGEQSHTLPVKKDSLRILLHLDSAA